MSGRKLHLNEAAAELTRARVWLWPNLLSLDAPVVALLWQMLFVRCLHGRTGLAESVVLGLAVWLIYAADRMLDAWRGAGSAPRHGFYGRHWRALSSVWIVTLAAGAWLAWAALPAQMWLYGAMVTCGAAVYLAAVHGASSGLWPGAKEVAVGVVFALGVSLVAWPMVASWSDVLAIAMFSVLCWINCVAIEDWEHGLAARNGVWLAAAAVAVMAVVLLPERRPVLAAAETASALGIVLLDRFGRGFSRDALRVLADVALLSPLLFLHMAGKVV